MTGNGKGKGAMRGWLAITVLLLARFDETDIQPQTGCHIYCRNSQRVRTVKQNFQMIFSKGISPFEEFQITPISILHVEVYQEGEAVEKSSLQFLVSNRSLHDRSNQAVCAASYSANWAQNRFDQETDWHTHACHRPIIHRTC